ncbi:ATP-binding protein [Sphaerotilus montanus]|uniref:ATP-binding protein n=1 Tax=Sphaerotilus montanus TaxID=522889 RepID=UPI003FA1CA8A
MQLRLVHTLSLTLLAFAGVAVLALGGLTAWHLRNGFGEYLASRDVLHFERFVGILESRLARDDGLSALRDGRLGLTSLLDELNPRPRPGERGSPSMPPPPPSGRSDGFPQRIQVIAPDGTVLLGEPGIAPPNAVPLVERPVRVNGEVVAVARMRPAPMVRTGAEARFLRDQYALIAAGGLGLIVLAVLTATWLARRWTRPLAAVQEATQRLAQGELTVRLPDGADLAGRSDEIGDVMRNVNRMAEGLQQLEGVRRRWLADISHELRTPLTVLRGDIEALQDGVRPLRPEAIAVLHEEVLRLNKLVDDLHLLAIADLQTLPCHLAEDDALALVRRLHRRYEARACAAGLDLRLEVPDELSALNELTVEWDAGRIEQLLDNLMENSLRYTESPGQVRVRLSCVDDGVRVVVDDSAPGVPAEQRAQLFEPLYRGDAARRSGTGGRGLGLAICQTIAKAHGGRLTASASALGGLCLTLDLPRSTSSATSSTGGAA